MVDLIGLLQKGEPEDAHENLCHLIAEWLPKVGMNGLIDLMSGMEQAREHDYGEVGSIQTNSLQTHVNAGMLILHFQVWGVNLNDFSSGLLDISGDWKHDLGAFVIARLDPSLLLLLLDCRKPLCS